jgi:hypothetical protein
MIEDIEGRVNINQEVLDEVIFMTMEVAPSELTDEQRKAWKEVWAVGEVLSILGQSAIGRNKVFVRGKDLSTAKKLLKLFEI